MLHRLTVYSLAALMLMMLGMFVSAFTFGEYTMVNALQDTAGIMWAVAMTDCIYNILKGWLE